MIEGLKVKTMDKIAKLRELKELLDSGVVSPEEYAKLKSEVMGSQVESQKEIKKEPTAKESIENNHTTKVDTKPSDTRQSSQSKATHTQSRVRFLPVFLFGLVIASYLFWDIKYKDKSEDKSETQTESTTELEPDEGPKLENEAAIKGFILGKWNGIDYSGDNTYFRFEITVSHVRYWKRFGEWDWPSEPQGNTLYRLSDIRTDLYGHKYRTIDFVDSPDGQVQEDLGLLGNKLVFDKGCLRFASYCMQKGWN